MIFHDKTPESGFKISIFMNFIIIIIPDSDAHIETTRQTQGVGEVHKGVLPWIKNHSFPNMERSDFLSLYSYFAACLMAACAAASLATGTRNGEQLT